MQNDEMQLKGDKKLGVGVVLRRTLAYVRPELKNFVLAFVMIIFHVALDIILPLFIGQITTLLQKDTIVFSNVLLLVIAYFLIGLVNQVLLYFESMLLQRTGQKIIYNLRMEVFEHIENMSQNQLDIMPVGSLVTRVASYTASMSDLFTNVIVSVIRNLLTVVGVYVIMIIMSPTLSLMLLAFVVVVFISSFIFSKIVTKVFRNERKYLSDLNTFMNENLSGMKLIQIFNQQKTKEDEFLVKNNNLRKAKFSVVLAFGIYRPFITLLYGTAQALTFLMGINLGLAGGVIVSFYLYLSKFFNPIQNLADQVNNIQKAFTASERLFNLLDVEPEVSDSSDAIEIERFEGKIEFKHVWFAYKENNWILKDVSFVIEPKQTCAFVGATGAGKTTILALIVRNYEIQKDKF